jgi:hypothetical protein
VVRHDHEGVELKAAFGPLVLKDFKEQIGVLFDLEEASAIGGDSCDEVGAEFLRGEWHGGGGKENPGLKPLQIVREFVGLKPHANPKRQRQRRKSKSRSRSRSKGKGKRQKAEAEAKAKARSRSKKQETKATATRDP